MVLLVLLAPSSINIDSLQVLPFMAPKQDRVNARGWSKSVAPSARLVIGFDDEHDPEYVPTGTSTPSRAARAARATKKRCLVSFNFTSYFHLFRNRKPPLLSFLLSKEVID